MDGLRLNKDGLEFQINDFEFVFDSNGNLIARHTDTGNELVFNSDGSLDVGSITGNPDINADSVTTTNADIGKLIAALDANNQDVSNVGNLDATALEATDVMTAPKYPTRSDVPDKEGIYRVEDVDGEGNFGVIVREI